ncbi:MAG: hypothetical protein ACREP8_08805, partial [Candidatus Binatia bacterium]
MFGSNKTLQALQDKVEALDRQLKETQEQNEKNLKLLRTQLAAIVAGLPPTGQSILLGLPYSEIPKDLVPEFIRGVPQLLILDLRGDEGWAQGYIPQA